MSYRDYLEEQRKYIKTKKEARLAKEERLRNPRPPRLDPPPVRYSMLHIVLWGLAFLVVMGSIFYLTVPPLPAAAKSDQLTVWIHGTQHEFEEIKEWLASEIRTNNLSWSIQHFENRQDLIEQLVLGQRVDLFLLEFELAQELYLAGGLVPILDKRETTSFTNTFENLWEPQPFVKNLGWAIPQNGDITAARHLLLIVRQFSQPFSPKS